MKRRFPDPETLRLIRLALNEDGAFRDVTTVLTVPARERAEGAILARQGGILAGMPVALALFRILHKGFKMEPKVKEGHAFKKGAVVARLSGSARAILSGERTALNLLSRLSGVATLTRAFVQAAGRPCIYDTRKTLPLWRSLDRYAVLMGGGCNHRFNLASHVLVKDNHRSIGGGVYAAVSAARRKLGAKAFVEAEVESELQAREALKAGADALLFDNLPPGEVGRLTLRAKKEGVLTEASGGVRLDNVRAYADTGVDRISVGALTHSALPVDFSLELDPPRPRAKP